MGVSLAIKTDSAPLASVDSDWLRGRTIVHKIVIGLTDPNVCMRVILNELSETAAEIRALTLKPTQDACFEVVLHANGLSAEDARDLVGRIAAYPAVKSAAIEHMLIR